MKTPTQTQKLLLAFYEYCKENDLAFFVQEKGFFHKIYVSSPTTWVSINKQSIYDMDYPYYKLNKAQIINTLYNIDPLNLNKEETTCSISVWGDIGKKHTIQLFVDAFWKVDKSLMQQLSQYWFKDEIDLASALTYKTRDLPKGFLTPQIRPYSENKNWRHLLEIIPQEKLANSILNDDILNEFTKAVKSIKENTDKHSSLNFLIEKVKETKNENIEFVLSKSCLDIFSQSTEYLQMYARKLPPMKPYVENKIKESLFSQDDPLIVQKVKFLREDIYYYFSEEKLKGEDYFILAKKIIDNMNTNENLISSGLNHIDSNINQNITCYLNLEHTEKINKDKFSKLFIQCMQSCVKGTACLPEDEEIKSNINKIIAYYFLHNELNMENYDKGPSKKIKI